MDNGSFYNFKENELKRWIWSSIVLKWGHI